MPGARRRTVFASSHLPVVLTCLVIAALAVWRLSCVRLGPDPDTDAYGHYVIARQLLETPLNFKIHWVWLPVYHFLLALGVQLGATLDDVRSANAVIAALTPLLLLWVLRRTTPPAPQLRDAAVPYLAALLCAATPLVMQIGTTGQMELSFALMLLGAAALLQAQRYGLAAALLSIAVLTRYEAWAAVLAVAAVFAHRRLRGQTTLGAGAVLCVLAPAVGILGWAALRAWGGEPWFGFILDNQAFAEAALDQRAATSHWPVAALGRYVLTVPLHVMGVAAFFAALGCVRALRQQGVWFVALPLAVLAFLTASSLTRSQLGLDRHFLAVIPFAATWAAHGVAQSAEWLTAVYERATHAQPAVAALRGREPSTASETWLSRHFGAASFALVGVLVVVSALARLEAWMSAWRRTTETALLDSRAAGRFLAATPPCSVIVCDDAAVEVLSGLDGSRFVRSRVEPRVVPELLKLSRSRDVYVISRAHQMSAVMSLGNLAYGGASGPADRLVAVHVPGKGRPPSSTRFGPVAGSGATSHGTTTGACPSEGGG